MTAKSPTIDLPEALRKTVKWSVAVLGEVIREELGAADYARIERIRRSMAAIRTSPSAKVFRVLGLLHTELAKLPPKKQLAIARAYTLMFEVINICESAYRTSRLRNRKRAPAPKVIPEITYVLTAHPTEARSPANIAIFRRIQSLLTECFGEDLEPKTTELRALLAIAWRTRIVRQRKPRVQDEAEHIYTIALSAENLRRLLDFGSEVAPVSLRSWVGGDKDGHPGVDETTMLDSLDLSRSALLRFAKSEAEDATQLSRLFSNTQLRNREAKFRSNLRSLKTVRAGDQKRLEDLKRSLSEWQETYRKEVGEPLPSLHRLSRLLNVFPALVVPLELREDSSVIMSDPLGKKTAIARMLKNVGALARGGDPRAYVGSVIISMASSVEHVRQTAKLVRKLIGNQKIPIVPLFEQKDALDRGAEIVSGIVRDPVLRRAIRKDWGGRFEVMLGYSDSSKESGVLSSRLAVTKAMLAIDRILRKKGVQPVFFHGSGGSIDRGGGSVTEQVSAWPDSAIRFYKATIQGEMVERNFASPEIAESRFQAIIKSAQLKRTSAGPHRPGLSVFAERAAEHYRKTVADSRFLKMVERATPYRYLNVLKMGSRPSKRAGALSVPGLRAIPWVLCWTQTRVLFQTWWGIGSAWESSTLAEKRALRKAAERDPLFGSFLQAFGFTLAKIELPVWEFYLSEAQLGPEEFKSFRDQFRAEYARSKKFFEDITGQRDPVWKRPWLGKSIELRASLIHPLNVLEVIAQRSHDVELLRTTVTGIASGMLTTG